MPGTVPLTFLGTGNALAEGRYWSSFLVGGRVLVEPSPAVLPNLRRAGADLAAIDTVFLSHFHADHMFGWPFLLLEYLLRTRRRSGLWVVGPPGVEAKLAELCAVGDYPVHSRERGGFDLHFVEATGTDQEAGPVRFRAERVEHVPELECFGYVIEHAGRRIGYTGDSQLCAGVRRLAAASDLLVAECNQPHPIPGRQLVHMTHAEIATLRREFPGLPLLLTHVGADVDSGGLPDVRIPADLETIDV